ncbi:MAG: insulinase family protein [Bacteroidales bacterium]|nr:insulinase family protein [Bacteroidales bacterium]MDE7072592.1 insulinase family protein [Bacteroidales bacterium]
MKFDYSKLQPETRHLTNGVPVYGFPDSELELVRLEFIFEAGSYFQQKAMQAAACCSLIGAGTRHFTADALSEQLDYYGAYIERYPDRDQASVVFYCLSRYFEQIIPFCQEALKHSVFPQEEIDTYLRKNHRRFLVNNRKVSEVSRRAFYSLVFGPGHPYGRVVEESDFAALKREDLTGFYKRYYVSENCKIVLAGGYTERHLKLLDQSFGGGDWSGAAADLLAGEGMQVFLPAERRKDIEMKDSLQASVRIGMPICSFKDEGFADFKIADYVLGGYFGSRLMRNIREEKGYTYGISSYIVPLRYKPVWMISSEVKADCVRKVFVEIEKEISALQKKEIPVSELELVRQSFMGDFMRDLDGTFDIAERMKFFIQCGIGPEFYQRNEETLFSITPAQIRRTAIRWFDLNNFCSVTVGAGDL